MIISFESLFYISPGSKSIAISPALLDGFVSLRHGVTFLPAVLLEFFVSVFNRRRITINGRTALALSPVDGESRISDSMRIDHE